MPIIDLTGYTWVGNELETYDGFARITSIEKVEEPTTVYSIYVEGITPISRMA